MAAVVDTLEVDTLVVDISVVDIPGVGTLGEDSPAAAENTLEASAARLGVVVVKLPSRLTEK